MFPTTKPKNYIAPMLAFFLTLLVLLHFLDLPTFSTPLPPSTSTSPPSPFSDLRLAFHTWDSLVGCPSFRHKHSLSVVPNPKEAIQEKGRCREGEEEGFVRVLVKGWTWIPDNLENLYACGCGVSCLWSKSEVIVDRPDAVLFENVTPPKWRHKGEPLRVYMDLEASRKPSGYEDIFVGYHANDDVQVTYAGALFHNNRNYHVSSYKRNDSLVYWSSSRCLPARGQLAEKFLSLVPHHSFGKCLNNMGGLDMALVQYPECAVDEHSMPHWWDHLHCAMSHYKFVLAIENTMVESYVTEKLYYALDAGSVPIYFGAPNVWDFVPPNSIIDGSKFSSMEELASYVKALANDPVAYAEYHAWRRCGVLGNYGKTRATSLDTLPCRLCELINRKRSKVR